MKRIDTLNTLFMLIAVLAFAAGVVLPVPGYLGLVASCLGAAPGGGGLSLSGFGTIAKTLAVAGLCAAAACALAYAFYKLYEHLYFRGEKFQAIKLSTEAYVKECNELNAHVHELESTPIPGFANKPRGTTDYHDASRWNYGRRKLDLLSDTENVYECSRAVCANARKDPMKYICKYFGIRAEAASLYAFEELVNNYSAAIEGKKDLEAKRQWIVAGAEIPWLIRRFSMKTFEEKLGFEPVGLSEVTFPRYRFLYVSPGGNASLSCDVEMDMDNLETMLEYLDERVKWKKSAAGQRALMTPRLRKAILGRDGYTCKRCGVGTADEPHLLLEVDHIVPISKGGLTSENNLQTLCWKCNRSKGAKLQA